MFSQHQQSSQDPDNCRVSNFPQQQPVSLFQRENNQENSQQSSSSLQLQEQFITLPQQEQSSWFPPRKHITQFPKQQQVSLFQKENYQEHSRQSSSSLQPQIRLSRYLSTSNLHSDISLIISFHNNFLHNIGFRLSSLLHNRIWHYSSSLFHNRGCYHNR